MEEKKEGGRARKREKDKGERGMRFGWAGEYFLGGVRLGMEKDRRASLGGNLGGS